MKEITMWMYSTLPSSFSRLLESSMNPLRPSSLTFRFSKSTFSCFSKFDQKACRDFRSLSRIKYKFSSIVNNDCRTQLKVFFRDLYYKQPYWYILRFQVYSQCIRQFDAEKTRYHYDHIEIEKSVNKVLVETLNKFSWV